MTAVFVGQDRWNSWSWTSSDGFLQDVNVLSQLVSSCDSLLSAWCIYNSLRLSLFDDIMPLSHFLPYRCLPSGWMTTSPPGCLQAITHGAHTHTHTPTQSGGSAGVHVYCIIYRKWLKGVWSKVSYEGKMFLPLWSLRAKVSSFLLFTTSSLNTLKKNHT